MHARRAREGCYKSGRATTDSPSLQSFLPARPTIPLLPSLFPALSLSLSLPPPPYPYSSSASRAPAMGCGGSKEGVATGNNTANGNKLFRRKSTVSASHRSSRASSSTLDDTSVAVKDVVKETAAGEAKADAEVKSAEKPVAVVEETKEEEVVVKKDVTDDAVAVAATTVTEVVAAAKQPPKKEEEEELPKSTMVDAAMEAEAKVDEAKEVVVLKEEEKVEESKAEEEEKVEESKAEEESPASTNEDG